MIVLLSFALLAGAGTALSPCVLPVLPALLSAGAVGGRRRPLGIRPVATAIGCALVLLALSLGGRRLLDGGRRAGRGPAVQRALGLIMILTAVALLTNLDVNFDQLVAQNIPDVNITAALECSSTVTSR